MSQKIQLNLPKSWEDITPEQFRAVAWISFTSSGPFSDLVKLLFSLVDLNENDFLLSDFEDFEKHSKTLEFLKNVQFAHQFVPIIRNGSRRFIGYQPAFEDMSYSQWVWAFIYANKYRESKKEEDLDKLISVLHLAAAWNEASHKHLHVNFTQYPKSIKQAVWLCYLGNMQHFKTLYPKSFEEDGNIPQSSSSLNEWDRLTDELAGPKFGTHQQTKATDVHTIFIHLENLREKEQQSQP